MKIGAPTAVVPAPASVAPAPPVASSGHVDSPSSWTNPAAAAAMHASVDMLKTIEDGIVANYNDVGRAKNYAADLHSTNETFDQATSALASDQSQENDQFLPLINRAGTTVATAEGRLNSHELGKTWTTERSDILSSIRNARVLSDNVARQLDPTTFGLSG